MSPALGYSPMCGADLSLDAGADVMLAVEEGFEYGVFVVAGSVVAESTTAGVDQLLYLGARPARTSACEAQREAG